MASAVAVPETHPEPDVRSAVDRVRAGFASGATRSLDWRKSQLDALEAMLVENEQQLLDALKSDLGKCATEAYSTEIGFTLGDIDHQRSHLSRWAKPRRISLPSTLQPGKAHVRPEPKGTVLIIAPWNYPLQLMLTPLAAAIAAGNAAVAKPSELAPATAAALTELAERYLDTDCITFINGGVPTSTALLAEPFDHIFFTGSTRVGKVVMEAAAKHLTPVTLELGGKSPAIVNRDADLEVAARRLAWGKFLNAGQTCVAPDYVLADKVIHDELVDRMVDAVTEFYGSDPQQSADYGRIVSQRHLERLRSLVDGEGAGQVVIGGNHHVESRYFAPTILTDTDPESEVMADEIFGPVLPVLKVDSILDATRFVNERPKPLALYVFAEDDYVVEHVLENTSSGGVGVNNAVLHLVPPDLPFGGIGPSGMGAYHGKTGFDTFSHHKSVYQRATWIDPKLIYPPYTNLKDRIIRRFQ